MKSKLFTCLAMLFLSFSLMAQTKQVSGTVVDEVGPVAGASVIEKGTQNGAVTVMFLTAYDLYNSPETIAQIKAEFDRKRGEDFIFEPLIGDRKPPLDYRK